MIQRDKKQDKQNYEKNNFMDEIFKEISRCETVRSMETYSNKKRNENKHKWKVKEGHGRIYRTKDIGKGEM